MCTQILSFFMGAEQVPLQNLNREELSKTLLKVFHAKKFSGQEKTQLTQTFTDMAPKELADVLEEFFENIAQFQDVSSSSSKEEVEDSASSTADVSLSDDEVLELLDNLEKYLMSPEKQVDPFDCEKSIAFIEKITDLIPLNKLQEIAQSRYSKLEDALNAAKLMIRSANNYFEATEHIKSPDVKARLLTVLSTLLSFLDSIIAAFGIADFFKPAQSEFQNDFKFQKIVMLISLFTFMTATLLPMFGLKTASSTVGGILLFIAVLSLVWPKIRPSVPVIPDGKNWTEMYKEGKLVALGGREITVDDVKSIIKTNREFEAVKEHILGIGASGIGKTETGKNLVAAIEKDPELKGMEVLYFNTADLVNSKEMFSNQNKSLQKIVDAIKSRKKNVIIIMDEIHLACQVKEDSVIGEQLKTILDTDFPNVLGFTTVEEFARDIYVNNSAFLRRFVPITIKSTEPTETKEILSNFLLKNGPKGIVIEDGVLDEIIEQTKDQPQPLAALKIASRCLRKMTRSQKTSKDTVIKNKINEIKSKDTNRSLNPFAIHNNSSFAELRGLLTEYKKLLEEWKKEKKQVGHLFQMRDFFGSLKRETFLTVKKVSKVTHETLPKHQKELKNFLMLEYFVGPAVEKVINAQSCDLDVRIVLNRKLVREVIEDKARAEEQLQEIVKSARAAVDARAGK